MERAGAHAQHSADRALPSCSAGRPASNRREERLGWGCSKAGAVAGSRPTISALARPRSNMLATSGAATSGLNVREELYRAGASPGGPPMLRHDAAASNPIPALHAWLKHGLLTLQEWSSGEAKPPSLSDVRQKAATGQCILCLHAACLWTRESMWKGCESINCECLCFARVIGMLRRARRGPQGCFRNDGFKNPSHQIISFEPRCRSC